MRKKFCKASKLLGADRRLDALLKRLDQLGPLLDAVRQALPADCARHCLAAVPHGERLHLVVRSPAWGSRIRYFGPQLLQTLRHAGWRFSEIRLRVAAAEAPQGEARVRRARPISDDTARLLARVADDLPDSELSDALERLRRTALRRRRD